MIITLQTYNFSFNKQKLYTTFLLTFYNFSQYIVNQMDAVNKRIELLISELGLTTNRFSLMLGKQNTIIHNIIKGRKGKAPATPRLQLLQLISTTFGVSLKWLTTGEGEIFTKEEKEITNNNTNQENQNEMIQNLQRELKDKEALIKTKDELIEMLREKISLLTDNRDFKAKRQSNE